MKRSIITIFLLVVSLATQICAQKLPSAKITLHAKCEVSSAQPVTIGDIASVEAPAAAAGKIKDTVICTGPIPGSQRIVDAEYIRLKLNSLNTGCSVLISGAESVVLSGKSLKITSEQLEEAALQFVSGQTLSEEIGYGFSIQRTPKEIILPGGSNVEIQPKLTGRSVRPGANTVLLDVVADGKAVSKSSVTVLVKAVANVLVAGASIGQGTAVDAQNTKWEKRELTGSSEPIIMGKENADWVARRTIRAGAVITLADVELPSAIKSGDSIMLVVRCGGVSLTTTAQAKQSGRIGDNIRVRTEASNEELRARVVSSNAVEIVR
ncbi:MAG: flagellar basal body P-ring formation protein FlgA [Armatimonadetes bacterium]|jgi:flagella basal body P-ring formation protein FlgA|nr:flagellar basal body P-ring formation protein FlgA [Armatimonadota bacterium]